MPKNNPSKGSAGFENFYRTVYGDRWPALRAALALPARQVARANRFHGSSPMNESVLEPEQRLTPQIDVHGLADFYVMDAASIAAATALDVQGDDRVLDLCAAPGGKSLILAERLAATGSLVCNELSPARRARLRAVLEDYLPKDFRQTQVRVTGHDGTKWGLYEANAYDRVLLDAPCSGERHLLDNPEEMKLWSPARSKNLAVRQYALLTSALASVKTGGRIVYSTCSISPLENDAVIARLLKKRAGEAEVLAPLAIEHGEATEHGWTILPDRAAGLGPIYYAVIRRVE